MTQIKNRYTGGVIYEAEGLSMKDTLEKAVSDGTDLSRADLSHADLSHANLSGADLSDANLHRADLSDAGLFGAGLFGADLFKTNLLECHFEGTDMLNSKLAYTIFGQLRLDKTKNIETVVVTGPCIIDFETIKQSPGLPHKFLHKLGYSELTLEYIPDLFKNNGINMFPVFFSHSWANKDFAGKLYEALIDAGVQVWYDEKKMKPGDDIYEGINRGINVYDKLILVCSKDSLNSWWVNEELNRIFKKERDYQKEKKGKERLLIPITIDDTIFNWEGAKAESIKDKIIGDFRGWEDDVKFEKALRELIMALNVDRKEIDPKSFL